jgi:hypothetical protein
MEMDPATYARLTDIKRYITSEFEPDPATAGQEAGIAPRRRSAFQVLRAILGLPLFRRIRDVLPRATGTIPKP